MTQSSLPFLLITSDDLKISFNWNYLKRCWYSFKSWDIFRGDCERKFEIRRIRARTAAANDVVRLISCFSYFKAIYSCLYDLGWENSLIDKRYYLKTNNLRNITYLHAVRRQADIYGKQRVAPLKDVIWLPPT